jgi:predicted regulator of Ras-like GTPase activity (Roadblock/LC7/MglB family)
MQTLLGQLNAVPGVVGTLVSGADGRLLAHAFPPAFDVATLADAARSASESSAGLATVTGTIRMLDLRCTNARILVRPVSGANLLFLCAPSMNLQPLAISASIVAAKIEKLVAGSSAAAPAPPVAGEGRSAGQLHAAVQRINAAIERRKLDPFKVRGEIAMKAGFGLGFIDADTPDDAAKLSKLKAAASAVLGEQV